MIQIEELVTGGRYQSANNTFTLEFPFDPNTECFRREYDGAWHLGREFIEFPKGRAALDLCAAPSPDTPDNPAKNQAQ